MKNLLFFIMLSLPLICKAQIKLSLGESRDSIEIPRMLVNGELCNLTKGHSLYSWKSKAFSSHIFKLGSEFFLYYSDGQANYFSKISKFEISSCEIYAEGYSEAFGKISVRDECGVLFRFSLNREIKYSHSFYRSYSDVIFKENVNQYFSHRHFKIQ